MIFNYRAALTTLIIAITSLGLEAMEAVVISLEAPLFYKKDLQAVIVQRVRKGDHLYIHNDEFGIGLEESDYATQEYFQDAKSLMRLYQYPENYRQAIHAVDYMQPNIFYKTLSKNGTVCYIQGKHIKIVYKDLRELIDNTPYPEWDPTDYRIPDPLSPSYPFYSTQHYRLLLTMGTAPSSPTNYLYNQPTASEKSSRRYTGSATYIKNISIDTDNRIYFGGALSWSSEKKEFQLSHDIAEELKSVLSIGPYISYDFYRRKRWYLTIFGNLNLNFDRTFIKVSSDIGLEQRIFSGFYPSLKAGINYNYIPFFLPNLNIFVGSEFHINPSYSLKAANATIPANWNLTLDDSVSYPFSGFINIFIGLNIFY